MTRRRNISASALLLALGVSTSACAPIDPSAPSIVGLGEGEPEPPEPPADPCAGFECGVVTDAAGQAHLCGAHVLDQHNRPTSPPIRHEQCAIGACSDLLAGGTCDRSRCSPENCGIYGVCDESSGRCVPNCNFYPPPSTQGSWVCRPDRTWGRGCAEHAECATLQACGADGFCRTDTCGVGDGCQRPGYVCIAEQGVCHPGCALPDYYGNPQSCETGTYCHAASGECRACDCPEGQTCDAQGTCSAAPTCDTLVCPADQYCRDGACRSRCELCPPGSSCTAGVCGAFDPCAGVLCGPGESCRFGICSGGCVTDIDCPAGLECELGVCVDG